ncbi:MULTISPECIES: chaperone NapD [unclassified Adlercreutzia]|uniref:chaperone NapD n=1 Tax=unclassified Adlercreutzia TaxID=2636013 RepID=UPI0013EE37BF|nr:MULTISPECIES: chaperone NapD [unclassified Adlercreutzia]
MVISSLVIETEPKKTRSVEHALSAMNGVEVHETQGEKLIVTIEADSSNASHEIASSFIGVDGVTGISLVYLNCEDEALGAQESV